MKTAPLFLGLLTIASLTGSRALAEPWDKDNDPARFESDYNYRFCPDPAHTPGALPLKGVLANEQMPWSSSYWPRNKGSINYTWNTPNPDGFRLNWADARRLSRTELEQLSPAQKLDVALGRYDYPLAKAVKEGSKKKAKDVEGICDGWSASSIQFEEPKPVDYKNADGIVVPFGSSDLKALLSYDTSLNQPEGGLGSVLIGNYCSSPWGMKLRTPNCMDINPGTFHVILANEIGLRQRSFVADIDPKRETWNQPVFGYEFEVTGSARSDKAPKAYRIHAKMMYAEDAPEDEAMKKKVFHWNPAIGTDNYTSGTLELDYILETDWNDRIVGGQWADSSLYTHPDIFWKATKRIALTPDFQLLDQLVPRKASAPAAE